MTQTQPTNESSKMNARAIERAEKSISCLQELAATGINLVGRVMQPSNNGTLCCDSSVEPVEVKIYPGLSEVYRWGKIREYGCRTMFVIVELKTGKLVWFKVKDQDSANEKLFAKLSKSLGGSAPMPANRTYEIDWRI